MSRKSLGIIILAAGEGTRMKSACPKVLHAVAGKPMLGQVIDTAKALNPEKTVIVTGSGRDRVEGYIKANHPEASIGVQHPQKGTGHAVMMARETFQGFEGDVLILFGDTPLIGAKTLQGVVDLHGDQVLSLIGFEANDAGRYGRLVLGDDGGLERIVEFKDASEDEKSITFCNSGVMIAKAKDLFGYLDKLSNDNAAGEYYLTDVVGMVRGDGKKISVATGNEKEFQGVNTKADLAKAEKTLQKRLRKAALEAGVTLVAPKSVHFSHDTKLGADVTVWPNVVFGEGVVVEEGATIHSFSHLENCTVRKGASVGPYARLRPGADIGEGAKIGNFVEVKKSKVGKGAKASHLSYIGDATVGEGANVGAGVITCNYDGVNKFQTEVGEGAFIGSNASLVAPVKIGAGAIVGAGSVITKDVPGDDLAVSRAKQQNLSGAAKTFRTKRAKD
jgi:bifunctional UDP-N-acetylglucosamine pyrophosphorylase/glucosamine-1-phosphate N-acetyltransferase